jgi:hypothetical protein
LNKLIIIIIERSDLVEGVVFENKGMIDLRIGHPFLWKSELQKDD